MNGDKVGGKANDASLPLWAAPTFLLLLFPLFLFPQSSLSLFPFPLFPFPSFPLPLLSPSVRLTAPASCRGGNSSTQPVLPAAA